MSQIIQLRPKATQADIETGLKALTATGGTLVLPKDETIAVAKQIVMFLEKQNITIDLNGSTLVGSGANSILYVDAKASALSSVSLGSQNGNATITYDKIPVDLKVGSWVKVVSDDALPGDHIDASDGGQPTRLGQAAEVVAIQGNTVILKGALVDQGLYHTNVRASTFSTAEFTIKNGAIDGGRGDFATAKGAADLIQLRNLVEPTVTDVDLRNGSVGLKIVNGVNADVRDVAAHNVYAGVQSSASFSTDIKGLFVEHSSHAVLVHGVGTTANGTSATSYGADIQLHAKDAVAYDADRAAFDFHSESRGGLYENVLAFDSRMIADFRGIGNGLKDSGGVNNSYALQFFEYGKGDGRDAKVSNVVAREIGQYAFMISGKTQNNTVTDSVFESIGKGYNVKSDVVAMVNSAIRDTVNSGDDVLTGSVKADMMLGGKGNDVVNGGAGNDYVWGGAGVDQLTGGEGRDRFAYHELSEGGDTITDFQAGAKGDILDVSVLAARLGWGSGDPLADGHLRVSAAGAGTLVQASDGHGGWTTLATLQGVKPGDFSAANVQWRMSDTTAALGAGKASAPELSGTPAAAAPGGSAPATLPSTTPAAPTAGPSVLGFSFLNSDGSAKAGETVTVAVRFDEVVNVKGGGLAVTLSNGAVATYAYGNGRDTLVFTYKVADGQDASDLSVSKITLGDAAIRSVKTGVATEATTAGGNLGDKLVIDTKAPVAAQPTLRYADSGLAGDGVTNAQTADLSGRADAGSSVKILDGSRVLGTVVADASGQWSFSTKTLADGQHVFSVIETDVAGNKSATSAGAAMTVDTKGPARPVFEGDTAKLYVREDASLLKGTAEALSKVDVFDNGVRIGGAVTGADGKWTYLASGLDEGAHRLTATATDVAGNTGVLSKSKDIVVDMTGPDLAISRLTATASGEVQLRGTISETPGQISVVRDGVATTTVNATSSAWTAKLSVDPSKIHTFDFSAKDAAGNVTALGDRYVLGTTGSERIVGTTAHEVMIGNGGSDTFVFKTNGGDDVVQDFKAGPLSAGGDVLRFEATGFHSLNELLADAHQVGGDVLIQIDDHSSVTLLNTKLAALTEANVLFA
ncbi:Ig-like domain-containing protein [uncultured Aureimonas sp.]|uniref:Ig-like domain-containing protein n=1 Tax=uncultured Aureimonas sp. TaxID=1604662 RepID=UPI0025F93EDC|nr:Ig-like domain-containing protein [uncultured Aureimonas sp.]